MVVNRNPEWNDKIKIGNLMARLNKHANGEIEMTPTQLAATKLFLEKTLPSLSSVANTQEHSGKIEHTVKWGE